MGEHPALGSRIAVGQMARCRARVRIVRPRDPSFEVEHVCAEASARARIMSPAERPAGEGERLDRPALAVEGDAALR